MHSVYLSQTLINWWTRDKERTVEKLQICTQLRPWAERRF